MPAPALNEVLYYAEINARDLARRIGALYDTAPIEQLPMLNAVVRTVYELLVADGNAPLGSFDEFRRGFLEQ